MNLHQTTIQYLIYLKSLGLSAKRLKSYQQVLTNIEAYYGPGTPIEIFDNSLVLDYVAENDPFDTDPVKGERGTVFCKFTNWLMKNRLIPAWAKEMQEYEEDQAYSYSSLDDFPINHHSHR